jgi:hypothetical protein
MTFTHLRTLLFVLLAALVACLVEVVQLTDHDAPFAMVDVEPGETATDVEEAEDAPVDGEFDWVEVDSAHLQIEFASHRFDHELSAVTNPWIEREPRPPRA